MTDFCLAGLNPHLLKKIITKLDPKSYFRMRQTCRGMDEFIQKNRNISVHIYKEDEMRVVQAIEKDSEAFYGIRFEYLEIPSGRVDQLCDFLRKHRITCDVLKIQHSKWSKEECAILFKIVKPVTIELNTENEQSNRYEAVFQSKTLKRVVLYANQEEASTVALRLLSSFPDVKLIVSKCYNQLDLLRIILTILCPQPPPNLLTFRFSVPGSLGMNFDQLEEEFSKFDLVITTERRHRKPYGLIKLPNGFSCKIVIGRCYTDVYYQEGYPDRSFASNMSSSLGLLTMTGS